MNIIRYLWRCAKTGRFVSRAEAESRPETTVRERINERDVE